MWELAAAIIGSITGVISLGTLIYVLGFKLGWLKAWRESVDAWMKTHDDNQQKYPPGETALMCKTMWEIYVVGALRDRPDLATHTSPFKLKPYAIDLIPDKIKESLNRIKILPEDREAVATGWLVVKHLGQPAIELLAEEKKLSVPETIAILSTYLDNHSNNCHPV